MRYWFDTEFIEDGKTIDLISIGIVAEDGREFYCINLDCDHCLASDWVKDNVIIHLPERNRRNIASSPEDLFGKYTSHKRIGLEVLEFCSPEKHGKPEFWAYYADYDWVAFCQLFGTMMELPQGFPMYCRDLKQTIDELGCPDIPSQTEGEHNALNDARWTRDTWLWLKDRYRHPGLGSINQ
jgi:hypothetical protein